MRGSVKELWKWQNFKSYPKWVQITSNPSRKWGWTIPRAYIVPGGPKGAPRNFTSKWCQTLKWKKGYFPSCQLNEIFCVRLLGQNCEFLLCKVFCVSCLFIVKFFKTAKTHFEKFCFLWSERIFDFFGLIWQAQTALSYAKWIFLGIEKRSL